MRRPLRVPELQRRLSNPNRNRIIKHFDGAPQRAWHVSSDLRFLFLCFTNRCGSTYLADLLTSTGVFGRSFEALNATEVLRVCAERNLTSLQEYVGLILRRDARNGWYSVKAAPEQIALMIDTGFLDTIVDRSHFLFIRRTDLLGQAISRAIAEQNGRWAWDTPATMPDSDLQFSAERLADHISYVSSLNQAFEQFFGLNGVEPINVEYERLVENPQEEMTRIGRCLGIPSLVIDSKRLRLRRQANEISRSWRARFLASDLPPKPARAVSAGVAVAVPSGHSDPRELRADVMAPIQNVGDVRGDIASWIGLPGSGLWLEGFSILVTGGMTAEDMMYSGIWGPEGLAPRSAAGAFCGTRSRALPLRGVCIELSEAARARFNCSYVGKFADGSTVGPIPMGQVCHSAAMAPMEAFKITVTPASGGDPHPGRRCGELPRNPVSRA